MLGGHVCLAGKILTGDRRMWYDGLATFERIEIMATATAKPLQVNGLGRHKLDELTQKARRLGLTPEKYVKRLVEEDLAVSHEARTKTFAQIMGTSQETDEEELDRLVERAKTRHHER
jgi:hypothetical protein